MQIFPTHSTGEGDHFIVTAAFRIRFTSEPQDSRRQGLALILSQCRLVPGLPSLPRPQHTGLLWFPPIVGSLRLPVFLPAHPSLAFLGLLFPCLCLLHVPGPGICCYLESRIARDVFGLLILRGPRPPLNFLTQLPDFGVPQIKSAS